MSAPQPPSPPQKSKGSWASLLFVVLIATAFVSFLALAPTGRLGIAVLVGGMVFPAIIALHYFTWGKWIRRAIERDAEEREPQI